MYTILSIHHKVVEEVKSVLRDLYSEYAEVNESKGAKGTKVALYKHGDGVCIVIHDTMPSPKLIEKINHELNTKIVTIGYSSTDGSYHFSVYENGRVQKVISYILDELQEKENVDLRKYYKKAIDDKVIRAQDLGDEESLVSGAELVLAHEYGIDLKGEYPTDTIFLRIKEYPRGEYPEYGSSFKRLTWEKLISG